jgi:hypothetical protein
VSALPYSIQWVGLDDSPYWHLAWQQQPGIDERTLCEQHWDNDNPMTAMMTPGEMRLNKAEQRFICKQCSMIYRTVLYMRMQEGKSVEDLRA